MEEKLSKLYADIKHLLKEADDHSRNSASGYDEGWYNGECNAYEIILEQLENIMKAEGTST